MALFSFHSTGGLSLPFEGFSLRWYEDVFGSAEFRDALRNSTIVAVATCAVTVVVGTMAAFGLSRTTPWQTFWRVTMPQIWPVLAGAACLAFALSFDEFIITFFVIGPESTMPMFIWSGLRRIVGPSINVISTVLMLITILLWVVAFLFTARAVRRGEESLDVLAGGLTTEAAA